MPSVVFYISPASPYVTPIWYMPTCFGWYWTPNDPSSDEVDSNWMPVTALAVVGGSWNGEIPGKKECEDHSVAEFEQYPVEMHNRDVTFFS